MDLNILLLKTEDESAQKTKIMKELLELIENQQTQISELQ